MKITKRTEQLHTNDSTYDSLTTTVRHEAETIEDILAIFKSATVESDLETLERDADDEQRQRIAAIRSAIETGDIRNAVWHALRAGASPYKRVIKAWELDARVGREVRLHGRRRNPNRISDAIVEQWESKASAAWKSNPTLGERKVAAIVAGPSDSIDTIRKKIRHLKPR